MARRARIRMNIKGIVDILQSEKSVEMAESAAERIRDASNAQSTWGGYFSARSSEGYPRARVWPIGPDASTDNARNQRLIRNLDAGRPT